MALWNNRFPDSEVFFVCFSFYFFWLFGIVISVLPGGLRQVTVPFYDLDLSHVRYKARLDPGKSPFTFNTLWL